jgi:phosphoribosylamine---glycine ligase
MLRLADDIVPYLLAAATGDLASLPPPRWRDEAAICVVLAPKGYPGAALEPDSPIRGVENARGEGVVVFHAGTRLTEDGALVTAGGRTLNVCATGPTLQVARDRAYAAIEAIDWPGGFFRRDIGWRALGR